MAPNSFLNHAYLLHAMAIFALVTSCNDDVAITYPPGGYDYPSAKDSIDTAFYYYPLKNILTRRDSFRKASAYIYAQAFNEPNLSIKPEGQDVFRFEFEGFKFLPVFVTFTKNEMVVKTGKKPDMTDSIVDENRLTDTEKMLYHFINRFFPLDEKASEETERWRRRVDSLVKLYPQILDAKFYKYLVNKTIIPNARHHDYSVKRISLSSGEFRHLISIINDSGYWKMPYSIPNVTESSDGWGFALEANTKHKYNYVEGGCDNDEKSKFTAICKAIAKCAGLEQQIIDVLGQPTSKKEPTKILIQDVSLADVKEIDSGSIKKKQRKSKHK